MPHAAFAVFAPNAGVFLPGSDSTTLPYRVGHRGELLLPDGHLDERRCAALLNRVFEAGNGMRPDGCFRVRGRAMAPGDIVSIEGCGTWRCEAVGWTGLAGAEARRFPAVGADVCPVIDSAAEREERRLRIRARLAARSGGARP